MIVWGGRFCSPILAYQYFSVMYLFHIYPFVHFKLPILFQIYLPNLFFSNTLLYLIFYYFPVSKSENTPPLLLFFKFMNVLICQFFQ